jgi:hypothetical protein
MRSLCFIVLSVSGLGALGALGTVGCGDKGVLPEPLSDNQADDPCDPGGGSTQTGSNPPVDAGSTPVQMPGGAGGIGFDDMRFSATLAQLLIPAGRTGNLDLVDPSTEEIASIGGFSAEATYSGDTTFGVTSADEGNDVIYATDRTTSTLSRIDPKLKMVTATLTLAGTPGYVRYVAPTNEVWVSEPGAKQIEIVALMGADGGTGLSHAATIAVAGAESLEIDATNGLAFTNTASSTLAIDLTSRAVADTWANGCTTAKGIAIDPLQRWVIVACNEGKLVVLGEQTGSMLGTLKTGAGVDRIAYDASRARVYVPSPAEAAMGVVVLNPKGVPTLAGSVQATSDAHCAATPGGGEVFVCSPAKGQVAFLYDPF